LGGVWNFAPSALFSENYLDPPHDKFLNTPLVAQCNQSKSQGWEIGRPRTASGPRTFFIWHFLNFKITS